MDKPATYDLEASGRWSRWVLHNGLPLPRPVQLMPSQSVPVAYWVGPRTAAVLHIRNVRDADDDSDGVEMQTEVDSDLFYRTIEGWECLGGGGGAWRSDQPLVRKPVRSDTVDLYGMNMTAIDGKGCKALWGEVGSAAAVAEVWQSGAVIRRRVEAPTGAFVVCGESTAPLRVQVFDDKGRTIFDRRELAGES